MEMGGTNKLMLGNSDFTARTCCFLFVQKPGEFTWQTRMCWRWRTLFSHTKPSLLHPAHLLQACFSPTLSSHSSCSFYFFSWLKLCANNVHFPQNAWVPWGRCCSFYSREITPLTRVRALLFHATSCLELGWGDQKASPPFLCMSHHHSQVSSPRMPMRLLILEDLSLFLGLFWFPFSLLLKQTSLPCIFQKAAMVSQRRFVKTKPKNGTISIQMLLKI